MRRVVTGHNETGKSVFVSDSEAPRVASIRGIPDLEMVEIWATDDIPTIPVGKGDPTVKMSSLVPEPEGTRFRIGRFPPGRVFVQAIEEGFDLTAALQEYSKKIPGLAEATEAEHPGMHTTDTIDYGVVISGEIWLELDDGAEVHLEQGDCVVQNGTRHAWRNRSSEPCVMAFAMVGAKRT
jgi:mannose-6-phosphate isomerase-like protein (cupin superfamily)